jgi:hypothetical protein
MTAPGEIPASEPMRRATQVVFPVLGKHCLCLFILGFSVPSDEVFDFLPAMIAEQNAAMPIGRFRLAGVAAGIAEK